MHHMCVCVCRTVVSPIVPLTFRLCVAVLPARLYLQIFGPLLWSTASACLSIDTMEGHQKNRVKMSLGMFDTLQTTTKSYANDTSVDLMTNLNEVEMVLYVIVVQRAKVCRLVYLYIVIKNTNHM